MKFIYTQMAYVIIIISFLLITLPAFGQADAVIPSSNRSTASLEKNLLFYADQRLSVTQSGSISLPLSYLFDGVFAPVYSEPINEADPYTILIDGLPNYHTQAGAWIGWTTRYWWPKKFKIEVYNVYEGANTWVTVADVSDYASGSFILPIAGVAARKIKMTVYQTYSPDNRLGLSEFYFIHPEASAAYDHLMVKYDALGKVGIGTYTPDSKLQVVGEIKSYYASIGQRDISTSTRNFANFSSNNHGSVLISSNLFVDGNDNFKIANTHPSLSGASILIPGNGQPNQGGIVFYTNNPVPVQENQIYSGNISMAIKASGNVGIGTSSPDEKLAVNGKIHAREVRVDAKDWPDYVFKPEYKLPSLNDLEKQIKEKGHLPDMPSAQMVETDGVALGNMVKQLLKSQEQLTLYIIKQEKQIKKLQQQLNCYGLRKKKSRK